MPMPTPTPRHHALMLAALLFLLAECAAAQPSEPWDRHDDGVGGGGAMPGARQPPSFSAPMVVLLVALIATFFCIGFFSIYIRQCGRGGGGNSIPAAALLAMSRREQQNQNQQPNNRQRGLDPDVLASFPAMTYAEARALREDKDGDEDAVLECAVCLSEFGDEEQLRLLPECSHAFHPDCIGEWLAAHVTCPVCRRSLVPEPDDHAAAAEANGSSSGEEMQQRRTEVAIYVDGEGEERQREAAELERIGSLRRAARSRSRSGRPPFSRAHSTGHSLSARLDGGDLERFTLRLPEQVRRDMVAAAGEESLRRTARSARIIGRSDRWPSFIARTFSSSRVPFWAASRRDAETAGGAPPGSAATTATPATIHEKTADASSATSGAKGSLRFDCLGGGGVTGARVSSAAGDSEDEEAEEEKAIVRRV